MTSPNHPERPTPERPKPEPDPNPSPGGTPPWVPIAVAAVGVLALAAMARSVGGLDLGLADGPAQNLRPLFVILSVAAMIVAAAAFARQRDQGYGLLHRAGTATAVLLVAAAIAIPAGLLLLGRSPERPPPEQSEPRPFTTASTAASTIRLHTTPSQPAQDKPWSSAIITLILLVFLAVVLAAIVVVLVAVLRRRRLPEIDRVVEFDPLAADAEQLAEAVDAGAEALEYAVDAREAVIACYAAMETALRDRGNGRMAADTPEEFLKRVTGAQLVPAAPANRLTELFREARFSKHPINEAQRDAARSALGEISAFLQQTRLVSGVRT